MNKVYNNHGRQNYDNGFSFGSLFERFMHSFVFGVGVGSLISLVYSMFYGGFLPTTPNFISSQPSLLVAATKSYIAYGVLGVIGGMSGMIYNPKFQGLSLMQKTVVNFGMNMAGFLVVGMYLKWFSVSVLSVVINLAVFAMLYGVIWVIMWFKARRDVMEINEKLKEKR